MINQFTTDEAYIYLGDSATLTWDTSNATSVTLTGVGTVQASGTQVVTPAAVGTYVYTLTAEGQDGPVTAQVTIYVREQP